MPPVRARSRQMVDALDGLNRVAPKPGFRPVHAKGICLEGTFTAASDARTLTRAAHMQGQEVPVTVRFSNASGYPKGSDTAKEPRGMAVKFHLPDNQSTDLVAMSTPFFPVGTVEDFLDIVRVQTRVPATGEPNKANVEAFLQGHPQAGKWLALVTGTPLPESFARITYHGIHAFRFSSAGDAETFVRYSWRPEAGVGALPKEKEDTLERDYLFDELPKRVATGRVVFTLYLQLAGSGDDVNDPTREWPPDRSIVMAGTLEMTRVVSDQQGGCEALSFDPTRVIDGIAVSDDPILQARGGAYAESAARRLSGRRSRRRGV